jgi:hypothetical protein
MSRETRKGERRVASSVAFTLGVGVATVALVGAVAACGPKPPPPHVVEVPIDQFDNGQRPPVDAGSPAEPVAAVAVTSETTTGGTRPSALATSPSPTSSVPPGQRLTTLECDKLLDKGAIQYGISKSVSVARAMRSIPQLRTQAQSDMTYAKVSSACTTEVSKSQYSCGMKSTNFDKWKACFESSS